MPSAYEQLRLRNMAANATKLQSLGVAKFAALLQQPKAQKAARRARGLPAARASMRVRSMPAPVYVARAFEPYYGYKRVYLKVLARSGRGGAA